MVKPIKPRKEKKEEAPVEVKLGPIPRGHPLVDCPCPGCAQPFKEGEFFSTVPIGPGGDPKQRELAREGMPYMAAVVPVHWACSTGLEDNVG